MNLIRTPAIILRGYPYRESDKIVSCYTRAAGKISLLAFGARRPTSRFSGCLEPLVIAEIQYRAKAQGLVTLDHVDIIEPLTRVRATLSGLTMGLYIISLISKYTIDGAANPELFNRFHEILVTLNHEPKDPRALLRYTELSILAGSGFQPRIQQCAICGATRFTKPVVYQAEEGKLYCERCHDARSGGFFATPAAISFLQQGLYLDPATIGNIVLSDNQHVVLTRFLRNLLVYHFDLAPEFMDLTCDYLGPGDEESTPAPKA